MKTHYIKDVFERNEPGRPVEIFGWIASKRKSKKMIFLDLVDSTGKIQAIITKSSELYKKADKIPKESSIRAKGILSPGKSGEIELDVKNIEVLGLASMHITPAPRSHFNIFEERYVNHILKNRHLYLRNEKFIAVFKFRNIFLEIMRDWFNKKGFIEFHGPILTELLLYDDEAISFNLKFFNKKVFLTQCVAFYLESAIHAFEKVYCINPSFRAEKSSGKRYLAEYWHVKCEIAFANLEDTIYFVENMISYLVQRIQKDAKYELEILGIDIDVNEIAQLPFPKITYEEALDRLKIKGIKKEFGKSLSDSDLKIISKEFDSLFWINGMPRIIEPFPYKIDPSNQKVTKTADLIAPSGFGELLGVAEKIWQLGELIERLKEKGKNNDKKYKWYRELRELGSVPHSGFGMGIERVIRWLLRLNHVRDAIAFPRLFKRTPNP